MQWLQKALHLICIYAIWLHSARVVNVPHFAENLKMVLMKLKLSITVRKISPKQKNLDGPTQIFKLFYSEGIHIPFFLIQ